MTAADRDPYIPRIVARPALLRRTALSDVALHVAAPLALGASVYGARAAGMAIAATVRDSGPDAAWGYALGASIALVWRGARSTSKAPWLVLGVAFAALGEIAQLARAVPGTFDPVDLAVIVVGYVAGAVLASRVTDRGAARARSRSRRRRGSRPRRARRRRARCP